MKQLIASIAIIVFLIAFFVIIDRKEFCRHDDVQTVLQSETSTINKKPTISLSGTKPVAEVKLSTTSSESIDRQTDRKKDRQTDRNSTK